MPHPTAEPRPLWRPSPARAAQTNLTRFIAAAEQQWGVRLGDFAALYRWSIAEKERFWLTLRRFCGVIAETWGEPVLRADGKLSTARFFPGARLNFAENLLRRRGGGEALIFADETGRNERMTWEELYQLVSRLASALRAEGVEPGDRVAGYLPNHPLAVAGMLAAASIGAVWTSGSPDFGAEGILDRFGQVEPKVLLAASGYPYKGRVHSRVEALGRIRAGLPSLRRLVVLPHVASVPDQEEVEAIPEAVWLDDYLAPHAPGEIAFAQLPFNHPLYVMYSSGTTGKPKCIVHGAGGTLLQHLKEHQLHCDVRPGDRVFYFTTCGWMMWNWLASALASEATLVLYDGSPFHPSPAVLWDLAEEEGVSLFGTSAKYLAALEQAGLRPAESHDLGHLRLITSTGSPLAPEGFDYVYEQVKPDVQLASISGGTDIIGCFVCGNPLGPVWRGEIQTRALGMAVEIFDDEGRPLRGEPGELVCTEPFPSMPLGFWGDPEGERYREAYFERFPGVWCHGDWAELTDRDGVIIHGRSDALLNPGGVRIGTAEIYRQVEQVQGVVESIAVGQRWQGDVRVVLFVVLEQGTELSEELVQTIKTRLRQRCSPHHVPAHVLQVSDIPRTKSGKITELAVRDVIHGRPVKNKTALKNPEALEQYQDRPELKT